MAHRGRAHPGLERPRAHRAAARGSLLGARPPAPSADGARRDHLARAHDVDVRGSQPTRSHDPAHPRRTPPRVGAQPRRRPRVDRYLRRPPRRRGTSQWHPGHDAHLTWSSRTPALPTHRSISEANPEELDVLRATASLELSDALVPFLVELAIVRAHHCRTDASRDPRGAPASQAPSISKERASSDSHAGRRWRSSAMIRETPYSTTSPCRVHRVTRASRADSSSVAAASPPDRLARHEVLHPGEVLVNGHEDLPTGGHDFSPRVATRIPRARPPRFPRTAM